MSDTPTEPAPPAVHTDDGPTVHVIRRVRAAGKYLEMWLDPPPRRGGDDSWDFAPKWDEIHKAVDFAGLHNHVHNHGYRGMRIVLHPDNYGNLRIIAVSTSAERPPNIE